MKELFNILSNVFNFFTEKRFIYQEGGGQDKPKNEPPVQLTPEQQKELDKRQMEALGGPAGSVDRARRDYLKEVKAAQKEGAKVGPNTKFEPMVIERSEASKRAEAAAKAKKPDYKFEPDVVTRSKESLMAEAAAKARGDKLGPFEPMVVERSKPTEVASNPKRRQPKGGQRQ